MTNSTPFDAANAALIGTGARRSASILLPRVLAAVGPVSSVLDVGCGAGGWLAEMQAQGATEILGIEGGHPSDDALHIPRERMLTQDLEAPIDLGRRFDMVISLEVGEHLPEASSASFVETLCRHANLILFSAAIPGQGGQWHINERWPSWWARFFFERGFMCFDIVRRDVWDDQRIDYWYRQNVLVYAAGAPADRLLKRGHEPVMPWDVAHPETCAHLASESPIRVRAAALAAEVAKKINTRVGRG